MSPTTTISTHVLDTALGAPAANIAVMLDRLDAQGVGTTIANGVTTADGRVPALVPADAPVIRGAYRLRFDVAAYFESTGRETFYSEIVITFKVGEEPQHYHVPLLLSPFGYATYRGS